jgi:hypothetical protein
LGLAALFRETSLNSVNTVQSNVALADGGFVVTWESNNQDGGNYGIYSQKFVFFWKFYND